MYKSIFSILIVSFLSFCACKNDSFKKTELKGTVFGTTYKIILINAQKDYQKQIDSIFTAINNSVSTYQIDSDISRINQNDTLIKIDAIFKEVFIKSKKIYQETDGYFDPTVGALVNFYGFGPKGYKREASQFQVDSMLQFVGFDKLVLAQQKIKKSNNNIFIDFNSIAKGFGIDLIARYLDAQHIKNYLIEIGGEIRTKGFKEENKPWVVQIVNPLDAESGFTTINLSNKSMATSGNYRKFWVAADGKKFVHTINPKTGFATESNLLSASVIGKTDCADVDAYATAFMAMGLEKAIETVKKLKNIDVFLIYVDEQNEVKVYSTIQEMILD